MAAALDITYAPCEFGRVGVLCGGVTSEREVSLNTGRAIFDALTQTDVDAVLFDVTDNFVNDIITRQHGEQAFDLVFIALHGGDGEGGHVQALLDMIDLPYTGSNMTASAICMDKILSKRLAAQVGLPVKPCCVLDTDNANHQSQLTALGFPDVPIVVKPSADGSSCGVSKVTAIEELDDAIALASSMSGTVMSEPWITGAEIGVGFVGDLVLPPVKMQPAHGFYDYDAKYVTGDTQYFCPTGLGEHVDIELKRLSQCAIETFGMTGWGRVDFIVDADSQPWLLEVNTVPGMTATSILPKAAETLGIAFADLLLAILSHAKKRASSSVKHSTASNIHIT